MLVLFSNYGKREGALSIIDIMLEHEEFFQSINNIESLPFAIEVQDIDWCKIR
jgi:hypothetical protein